MSPGAMRARRGIAQPYIDRLDVVKKDLRPPFLAPLPTPDSGGKCHAR